MLLLDAPYYEGASTVASDVPAIWPVAIGGHHYTIDLSEY